MPNHEQMPSSESLYAEHKKTAEELKQSQKTTEQIKKADPLVRLWKNIKGETKEAANTLIAKRSAYDENIRTAKQNIDTAHSEALEQDAEYKKSYQEYKTETERIIPIIFYQYHGESWGSHPWPPITLTISEYISESQKLIKKGIKPEECATMLATLELIKPMINQPEGGVYLVFGDESKLMKDHTERECQQIGFYNGSRVPNWELGTKNLDETKKLAKQKNIKTILKINTSLYFTYKAIEKYTDEDILIQKTNYLVIDDETTEQIKRLNEQNILTSTDEIAGKTLQKMHHTYEIIEA